ncbi:MAG: transglutaminase-like domain-containing protein [Pseudomonadota bacterium]|nr:transglutaminase-like domain-containing protein [Pseudomonadota bacterium]
MSSAASKSAVLTPIPRFWVSFALLAWGGFTNNLAGAFVMALMIEAIGFISIKWAMADREFHRAADLTSVIFALVTVIQFSRYSVHGIYAILTVAPYCLFPLILAQRASTRQTIPMSALFYSLRKHQAQDRRLDITPHFIAVCILAASTSSRGGSYFVAVIAIIVVGMLLVARPRRYRAWHWATVMLLALSLAVATQMGMLSAHRSLESSVMYWIDQLPWSPDPNRAVTAIGAIGRLKLSDRIRVRVTPSARLKLPLMLQEGTYDSFRFGTWSALDADFEAVDKVYGRNEWLVAPGGGDDPATIEITVQHRRALVLLPTPRGSRRIASDEIAELQNNPFGSLMAESPPGALRFRATIDGAEGVEPPPRPRDLIVPEGYQEVVSRTVAEIGITGLDQRDAAARIRQFFLDNFTYSLIQKGRYAWRTPLAHFLTETRRGHCEYFATATVLLLREAGIPARYAVGYVVENYSALERMYIARARHAHSWALAFIDGRWVTVDSTPSVWYELEDQHASHWQGIQDFLSWAWFRYQRLSQADMSDIGDVVIWLVPPLAVVLYFRLRRSPTAVRVARRKKPRGDSTGGVDSPLVALLGKLKARGLTPASGETLGGFLRRTVPISSAGIRRSEIISIYYRWRFSPNTNADDDEALLRQKAEIFSAAQDRDSHSAPPRSP